MSYSTTYEWEGDGYDPEADPVDLWQRQLTDLKAKRHARERQAEYLSRPVCIVPECTSRQTATGPLCILHFIDSSVSRGKP